jgi:hypothetical protein
MKKEKFEKRKANYQKIFLITILALVLLSFIIPLVVSQAPTTARTYDPLRYISKFFDDWLSGTNLSLSTVKILLWILISMMVYSIGKNMPGLKNMFSGDMAFLGTLFATIVGFLAMAYITPEEIYAIMTSYSALGFTLGIGLPFVIMMFFTLTLAEIESKENASSLAMKRILATCLWLIFTLYIGWRLLSVYGYMYDWGANTTGIIDSSSFLWISSQGNERLKLDQNLWMMWILWILFIISAFITFRMGKIFRIIRKSSVRAAVDIYTQKSMMSASKIAADEAAIKKAADLEAYP